MDADDDVEASPQGSREVADGESGEAPADKSPRIDVSGRTPTADEGAPTRSQGEGTEKGNELPSRVSSPTVGSPYADGEIVRGVVPGNEESSAPTEKGEAESGPTVVGRPTTESHRDGTAEKSPQDRKEMNVSLEDEERAEEVRCSAS